MISQKTILVVEDNLINRTVLGEILSPKYRVLEAENGKEALSLLKKQGQPVSLILLDIVMPVMDGYTFLSIVKADPNLSPIPVIVTTQSGSEADEVAALSHGATDFVAKPYKPQVILHRVASIINLRETAAMINQFQYDRLTGLYSMEFFYQRAEDLLEQHPEREYDIICSDIENFKLINDVFGMAAGDQLLRDLADLYRDVADGRCLYGRLNADQFAFLVERRREYTDEMFIRIGHRLNALPNAKSIVMKWGIYPVEGRSVPADKMCGRALLAARSIKGQYGKYFAAYDDKLRSKLLREQAILDSMESALAEGQFSVYFQPKYRILDGQLAGAEALVRWNHPAWGFLSPGEFIPLFEKNGFITKLDQFVWDRTCSFLRESDEKGYPPIPVSVNVSRADIYHADISDILTETVQKYGLPASRLHLEITESAYTEDPNQIVQTVGRLRQLGFVIEMDDFGSGYSSLNMLLQMPTDILKLDIKFIQNEMTKPAERGILQFIMELARSMCLRVVAEGVETKEQLDRLLETGCDYAQGYYFAKPMPLPAFEALVREQQAASGQRSPEQALQDCGAPPDGEKPLLLVADEDAQYRSMVRKTFEGQYRIAEAADADAALRFLAAHAARLAAAVVSLDLPGPDGFAVLEAAKREKTLRGIPLIATGPRDARLEERALELDAADYAAKPHTQRSLWGRVRRGIDHSIPRKRDIPARQKEGPAPFQGSEADE